MPNNKIISLLMFIATAAMLIYGLITNSKEKKKNNQQEQKDDAEIISIEPRLALRKTASADDEFYSLDNIDLAFLHVCKDDEGGIKGYSFDFMRNHDTHYLLAPAEMDKVTEYFNANSDAEYTVDAIKEYFDGKQSSDSALTELFELLGVEYDLREAEENGKD